MNSGPDRGFLRTAKLEDALQAGLFEKEFNTIRELLAREINILELGIFSALYSEHCSYKSTKIHLKTLPTTGEKVLQGPGENAGVIDIGDGLGVAFKVESHNHPSFIEPFQGAATGVGGILRDVFTMGARPLAVMNALRFGEPENAKTTQLLTGAVKGIGTYGNCVGIPTVGGELFFHESYNGNCLVNAFALGLVEHDKIFKGSAAGIGNPVIYVGSKTGRDGIHGASMASQEFDDNSEEKRPTVQVGDPFQEKLLLEACIEAMNSGAVVGIQDMGAAGLTSSSYEMASRAGTGLHLDLDQVPQREAGMTPYDLMLSESQERMLVIAQAGREAELIKIFNRWGLDCAPIGRVIEGSHVELYWHGELVSSLPVDILVDKVPQYRWPEAEPADFKARLEFPISSLETPSDLSAVWLKLMGSPNLSSRFPIYSQYDSTVRSNTVVHPGGDAGVIRIKATGRSGGVEKGVAMTLDCNSRFCGIDPRQGTALTLAEALRNITCVGAKPLGISDCLNFGNPEKPEGMWQIAESVRGLGEAARAFNIPVVSGNVSLYNETKGQGILPTPMLALVGLMEDASKAVAAQFQNDGDAVLVLGTTLDELGGSEYLAQVHGVEKGALPSLDYDREMRMASFILEMIDRRLLKSCHDISMGGLAAAFAECCLGSYRSVGATIEQAVANAIRKDALMFSESGARYIVSCAARDAEEICHRAGELGIGVEFRGVVGGDRIEIKGLAQLPLEETQRLWSEGVRKLLA